ncbi:tyrosine-type recombinase/integrase [Nocardia sp. NEAU-G5]|uniref:Tyrosine-type recombinase/integrase n=1 Tax=Nocardia albiluteola TaxID=2842303 RepID=A0ABS6AYG7_9NOCA|nr:site-specific integrase [Nocardia albiluteola]MBU3063096.1 tyrosine-type recombinase/integrase [Nocardia albiluteola]
MSQDKLVPGAPPDQDKINPTKGPDGIWRLTRVRHRALNGDYPRSSGKGRTRKECLDDFWHNFDKNNTKGSNRRRLSQRRRFALTDKMIDVFDYWLKLQSARVAKGEIVQRTYNNYHRGIKPAPKNARNRKPNAYKLEKEFGGLTIGEACNRLDIVDYLDEVFEVAPNTAMLHHVILKNVWKMLMTSAPIEVNPMQGIPQPKPGGYEPRALVGAEPTGVLNAITRWLEYGYSPSEYLPCYFLLLLGTGMRPSEAIAVRWRDVLDLDEERAIIHVCGTIVAEPFHRQNKRKRGPHYYVVAPRWLTTILRAWREFDQPASDEQAIFLPPYGNGDWLHPSTVQAALETLRTFRDNEYEWFIWTNLRDTVATVVAVVTGDDDKASAQLGHTSALRRTIAQRHYIDPKGRPIEPVDNADALETLALDWTPTAYRKHRIWIDRRRNKGRTAKVGTKLEKNAS